MRKLHDAVTAKDHSEGDARAPVTLVEYGDYECPTCVAAYPILQRVLKHFGERVRFVYRNFPLEMHPMAEPAAEAAEFAASEGKFWEMHDAIFERKGRLSADGLAAMAKRVGLDGEKVAAAIEEQSFGERIRRDTEGGEKSGVHGTPTYFLNGRAHEGGLEYDDLVAAIDEAGA